VTSSVLRLSAAPTHALAQLGVLAGTPGGKLATLAALCLVGALQGTMLGVLQCLLLRRRLPRLRPREWITSTIAITVLGWLCGLGLPLYDSLLPRGLPRGVVAGATIGAVVGALFGGARWLLLRRHAERAALWVAIHVPAWSAAIAVLSFGAAQAQALGVRWPVVSGGLVAGLAGVLILLCGSLVATPLLRPWVVESPHVLRGKIAAITGANDGIGYEIAMGLARLGASVVLLCRDEIRGAAAASAIRISLLGADIRTVVCDLGSFASVRAAAARLGSELPRLDILIHNAGATFPQRTASPDGLEATLAVDVVGPFLLTTLLREKLESCEGRVITLAELSQYAGRIELADLHFVRREYDEHEANSQAQRGRVLITAELGRRAPRLRAVSVHPGAVWTRAVTRGSKLTQWLVATILRPRFQRPELGALPVLRLAVLPGSELSSGSFFDRFTRDDDAPDPAFAQAFYSACEKMTSRPGD
jgi:retinol dehydrogenase-12